MSRTTIARSWLLALPTFALVSLGLNAQELKRVEIKSGEQLPNKAKTKYLPDTKPVTATNFTMVTLDDEPDYAPMEDVRDEDGNVIAVRRVGNPYVLAFTGGTYTPQKGIDPDLRRTLQARPEGHTYGYVMIRGRMSQTKMEKLQKIGLKLLEVHTWQSVKAKIPATALGKLEQLPFVHWVGYARTSQKIDVNFQPAVAAAKDNDLIPVIVNPFESDEGKDTKVVTLGEQKAHKEWSEVNVEGGASKKVIPNGRFQRELEAMGFEMREYNHITHSFRGRMTKKALLQLLKNDWVHSVELNPGDPMLFHDQEMTMVRQDFARKTYSGKNVPCGFVDSGIDATPWHKDFYGKSYVYFNNAITPSSDHGTHVAGTIWGNGSANSRYKGAAPLSGTGGATNRLFFDKLGSSVSTHASNMGKNYKDSGGKTSPYPRVISNSWGWLASGGYNGTEDAARTLDNATYSKKQLWVFASGNKKSTANMWCASPGSAKNLLTVGALTDSFNSTRTTQPGDRASFSRWGTSDLRMKPELSAPGNATTSTKWNSSTGYTNKSGTSMSTPLVSGCLISKIQASSWYKDKPEALKARAVACSKNYNTPLSGKWSPPQSGKSSLQETGYGLLNSTANIYTLSESQSTVYGGTFTASGQTYVSGAITVPSNAQYARLVLCYTEPAASSSASIAKVNDVRSYMDFSPYTSSNTTGDVTLYSSRNTVIVYSAYYISSTRRGKPMKIKVHAKSIKLFNQARWSVAILWYKANPYTRPYVTATGSSTPVKPNSTYVLTGAMRKLSSYDQFNSGRLWYDGSFSVSSFYRTNEDGLSQWYYSSNTHTSNPFPRVGKGASTGMVVGSGSYRPLIYYLKAPSTSGIYSLKISGSYDVSSSTGPLLSATKSVCVDGLIPKSITSLKSTSHTAGGWSNDKTINLSWSQALDNGCAGVDYLAWTVTTASSSSPTAKDASSTVKAYTTPSLGDSSSGWYFHIRSRDRAGNYGPVSKTGPFKIDSIRPLMTSTLLDNGATYNSLSYVNVRATATDNASGVARIRYWAGKYSPWYSYATSRNVSWSSILTSVTPGTKTVYVQVEDRAGNLSLFKTDSIVYLGVPTVSTASSLNYNVTKGAYVLTGTNLQYTNLVQFGAYNITRKWTSAHEDDWYNGRFRIVSSTTIYLYPPQARTPGTYSVRVRNLGGTYSNSKTTSYSAFTSSPYMQTQTAVTAGKAQYVICAQGNLPAGSVQITMFSTKLGKSAVPGVITMGIGANWSEYLLLPKLGFNSTTKCSIGGGIVPKAVKGFSAYFQSAFFKPGVLPGTVSSIWKTTYK